MHPFEQRISADPQLIPLLRIFIDGAIPHRGQTGKLLMAHTFQKMFVATQLANGSLKTLKVRQLRFCAADLVRDITGRRNNQVIRTANERRDIPNNFIEGFVVRR
ncbi:hypothetical protein SS24_25170 [Enterobacter hormaechei subsp. steigerwaltii]|nr:hypothetical protein SS35_25660 [Enterobacter hormaechei subsp. steigerwaltii]KJL75149.1 hypothetical protein SS24_25170 [Enterobacter hormaechei subsp. steigerwaltii]KJW76665.1 hypothetical protein SG68_25195 [Enterobacter hormaechei subsp. steigerwaltii]KJW93239.1 hypothetical protein SG69_25240 [Enterobacter hormaechei subsp. steigerwaltii]KJX29486.1 hypothetical protein SG78_24385 [Enterobacter hormaechei subsp. steigerwaltii]